MKKMCTTNWTQHHLCHDCELENLWVCVWKNKVAGGMRMLEIIHVYDKAIIKFKSQGGCGVRKQSKKLRNHEP